MAFLGVGLHEKGNSRAATQGHTRAKCKHLQLLKLGSSIGTGPADEQLLERTGFGAGVWPVAISWAPSDLLHDPGQATLLSCASTPDTLFKGRIWSNTTHFLR